MELSFTDKKGFGIRQQIIYDIQTFMVLDVNIMDLEVNLIDSLSYSLDIIISNKQLYGTLNS